MKNIINFFFLTLIFLISLASCKSTLRIGYETAGLFKKGDSYSKMQDTINKEPYLEEEVVLKRTNEKFKVTFYKRWIQTYTGENSFFSRDKYDVFVFTYKNEKLYFWGNIDDYKRSNDKTVNELGLIISEIWAND
ncbi:MAG: hypothetical protein NTW25_07685 [Candidatus Kapabacteria bacterium]|nr:hypothetical protein [Candidatus Kapabacteria bacterium]